MLFSKFIKQLSFSALAILAVPFFALAQGGEAEGLSLAEINVGDAVMNVTNDDIVVTFNITNLGSVPQSDIRYGTELLKQNADGGQVVVDRLVSEETVSVDAGQALFRNAKHPLSGVAPGEYSLWVVARTTGGIMLGLTNAGMVTITNSSAVSFLADTCVVTVGEEDGKYTLDQGVDVSLDEELYLSCTVKNYTNDTASVSPVFETHRRTAFGDKVAMNYGAGEVVTLTAGEEKTVKLAMPKADSPQAYDVVVALKDSTSGEIVSSHIGVHYVLRGASATIQTINFDKTKYVAGEPMRLTMYWSGPADEFADSRSGNPTELEGDVTARLSVTDGSGVACIDPVTQVINPGEVKLQAMTKDDCIDPKATLSLLDATGSTLDSRTIDVETPASTEGEASDEGAGKNPYVYLAFVALALAALAVLVSIARHRKINIVDTTKVLVLGMVAAGGLLAGAPQVEAVTWTHFWSNSSGSWRMGVTANANATTYTPGQTINLSSAVWNISCTNNVVAIHRLTATLGAQTRILSDTNVNSPTTVYGSGTLTAPTTPGNYVIRVTVLTKARGETSYRDIPITVAVPTVAAVGNFDSVDAATCSVTGWAYDPDASASSINVNVYRDQSAGAGGTYVTTCSANQYRADVNAARGITGNHGFSCALPASYAGTGAHNLYIHAMDTNGTPNSVITGSPLSLTCVAAPAATISGAGCTIPVGGSTCNGTVTWNITNATSPNVHNVTTASSYSVVASGTNQPITLTHGDTSLQARDNTNVLGSATISGVECAVGSSWNGSVCVANPASASLSATGCTIALGDNSCQGTITSWNISSASSPNVHNQTTDTSISNNASGNNVSITLPRGATTIAARNGSTVLATEVVNAICDTVAAPYWNGSECTNVAPPAAPQISLDLDKDIVRSGETAEITSEITAGYPTECTLLGATAAPIVFTHSGSPVTASYVHTTKPLTAAQQIQLTCEPNPAILGVSSASNEVRVNVVPSIQEI